MKDKKKKNIPVDTHKLRLWLLSFDDTLDGAAYRCKLSYITMWRILRGDKPSLRTALKLVKASSDHLTLTDLGHNI